MSLPLFGLKKFNQFIKPNIPLDGNVCFLSCPDIIARPEEIGTLFDIDPNELDIRKDTSDILNWHKAHKYTSKVVDTRQLFEYLGYRVTITDIVQARSGEEYLDLNQPLPIQHRLHYHFVFENCIDHCFNLGQAFMNAANMVGVGGYILHLVPLLMINHGFWSISPTTFYDFYEDNGFEIVHYQAFEGIQEIKKVIPTDNPYTRLKNIAHDAMQICIAKRLEWKKESWPVQHKFRQYPDSRRNDL